MNRKLLEAVRKSNWSIEEISGLTRIPEISLYRLLNGSEIPSQGDLELFAEVLGCEVEELFPGYEGAGNAG